MSSQIGLIIDQIAIEAVANSDLENAYDGHKTKSPARPYGEVYMDEFGLRSQEVNNTFDMPAAFRIIVFGAAVEDTRNIVEQLAKYFTAGPSATLQGSTMNVINIMVRAWAIESEEDETKSGFNAEILFDILIRYDYT